MLNQRQLSDEKLVGRKGTNELGVRVSHIYKLRVSRAAMRQGCVSIVSPDNGNWGCSKTYTSQMVVKGYGGVNFRRKSRAEELWTSKRQGARLHNFLAVEWTFKFLITTLEPHRPKHDNQPSSGIPDTYYATRSSLSKIVEISRPLNQSRQHVLTCLREDRYRDSNDDRWASSTPSISLSSNAHLSIIGTHRWRNIYVHLIFWHTPGSRRCREPYFVPEMKVEVLRSK